MILESSVIWWGLIKKNNNVYLGTKLAQDFPNLDPFAQYKDSSAD